MAATTTNRWSIAGIASLIAAATLVLLVPYDDARRPRCVKENCVSAAPAAQRRRNAPEETLLDKVGLGSLRDISWEALPVALALAALIGAAGGFVYSGIVGQDRPAKKRQETDRPSS